MTSVLPIVAGSVLVTGLIWLILRIARRGVVNFGNVGTWHDCRTCQGGSFTALPPSGLCRSCGVTGGHYTR